MPILMLTLVERLNVTASELLVSATVPAEMPSGNAVITSPKDGDTMLSRDITVSGTCPVISPAIIVAIYRNDVMAGSAVCTSGGTFSVLIRLAYGANTLVPRIVTITGEQGASGPAVTVKLPAPLSPSKPQPSQSIPGLNGIGMPLRIAPTDIFALINADGSTVWRSSFIGGVVPYNVRINWGDGNTDTYTIHDGSEQSFSHKYASIKMHDITIVATDKANTTEVMHIAGITRFTQVGAAGLDANLDQLHPVIAFIQKNVVQIYIVTLFALIFLWYIEHGRHITVAPLKPRKRRARH